MLKCFVRYFAKECGVFWIRKIRLVIECGFKRQAVAWWVFLPNFEIMTSCCILYFLKSLLFGTNRVICPTYDDGCLF